MYYTGTLDISFERVEAEDRDALKRKIIENLPHWLHAYNLEIEYGETKKDLMKEGEYD